MNMNKTYSKDFSELNRRGLFHSVFTGLAGIGLGSLLQNDSFAKKPHGNRVEVLLIFLPRQNECCKSSAQALLRTSIYGITNPNYSSNQASHFQAQKISLRSKARMAT